ncbi:MAG: flagellar hook-length control protein FliK [Bacillota bacterium]
MPDSDGVLPGAGGTQIRGQMSLPSDVPEDRVPEDEDGACAAIAHRYAPGRHIEQIWPMGEWQGLQLPLVQEVAALGEATNDTGRGSWPSRVDAEVAQCRPVRRPLKSGEGATVETKAPTDRGFATTRHTKAEHPDPRVAPVRAADPHVPATSDQSCPAPAGDVLTGRGPGQGVTGIAAPTVMVGVAAPAIEGAAPLQATPRSGGAFQASDDMGEEVALAVQPAGSAPRQRTEEAEPAGQTGKLGRAAREEKGSRLEPASPEPWSARSGRASSDASIQVDRPARVRCQGEVSSDTPGQEAHTMRQVVGGSLSDQDSLEPGWSRAATAVDALIMEIAETAARDGARALSEQARDAMLHGIESTIEASDAAAKITRIPAGEGAEKPYAVTTRDFASQAPPTKTQGKPILPASDAGSAAAARGARRSGMPQATLDPALDDDHNSVGSTELAGDPRTRLTGLAARMPGERQALDAGAEDAAPVQPGARVVALRDDALGIATQADTPTMAERGDRAGTAVSAGAVAPQGGSVAAHKGDTREIEPRSAEERGAMPAMLADRPERRSGDAPVARTARQAVQRGDSRPAPGQAPTQVDRLAQVDRSAASGSPHDADARQAQQAEQPQASTRSIIDQIVQRAELRLGRSEAEMVIDLEPDVLGRVHLKITAESGRVLAEIRADNTATRSLIEAGLPELKTALAGRGLTLEAIAVSADVGSKVAGNGARPGWYWENSTRDRENRTRPGPHGIRATGSPAVCWFSGGRMHVVDCMA